VEGNNEVQQEELNPRGPSMGMVARPSGSRVVFDNDGYLYISPMGTKEHFRRYAQDLTNSHGKIHSNSMMMEEFLLTIHLSNTPRSLYFNLDIWEIEIHKD